MTDLQGETQVEESVCRFISRPGVHRGWLVSEDLGIFKNLHIDW